MVPCIGSYDEEWSSLHDSICLSFVVWHNASDEAHNDAIRNWYADTARFGALVDGIYT